MASGSKCQRLPSPSKIKRVIRESKSIRGIIQMNNKWIEETHGWRKEIVKNNPTNANILLDRLLEMSD